MSVTIVCGIITCNKYQSIDIPALKADRSEDYWKKEMIENRSFVKVKVAGKEGGKYRRKKRGKKINRFF